MLPLESEATTTTTTTADPGRAEVPPAGRLRAFALGASILAGLAGWVLGEFNVGWFEPKLSRINTGGVSLDVVLPADEALTDRKNADLTYVVVGGLLGLALGTAGGWARSSGRARAAMGGGGVGLVLGAVGALLATEAMVRLYFREKRRSDWNFSLDLSVPMLIHAGLFAAIGAAGAASLAIGAGARGARAARMVVAGGAAGMLGAVAYELVGAILFPTDNTNRPIAGAAGARLIAMLCATVPAAFASATARPPVARRA